MKGLHFFDYFSQRSALRQPVVAVRSRFHSVGRSRYALDFGPAIGDNVTLPSRDCMANLVFRGTPIGGPLGWGDANKQDNIPLKSKAVCRALCTPLRGKSLFLEYLKNIFGKGTSYQGRPKFCSFRSE